MGIVSFLKKFFRKKAQEEALQSDVEALQSDLERSKALQALQSVTFPKEDIMYQPQPTSIESNYPQKFELQRDSVQLGIAAGYTGQSIRNIEASLNRIEAQMATKDWFTANLEDKTPELIAIMKKHEENEEKRFEVIQNTLLTLKTTAEKVPEPLKYDLISQIEDIESRLPLTRRMNEVLQIIKEAKEISYEELAKRLNWKETSGLRGLLTNMSRRTDKIERFSKDGKGFVRYIGN